MGCSRLVPLLVPALLLADEARACTPDPCAGVQAFVDLKRASDRDIPVDGVALFQANWFGDIAMLPLLEGLSLTVTREGLAVDGALEGTDIPGTLVWRPAGPLVPEAVYEVTGTYANAPEVAGVCAPAVVDFKFEFTAGPAEASPLGAAELRERTSWMDFPFDDLASLACCDGALPRADDNCGVVSLSWTEGQCTATLSFKRYKVELWLDVPEADEASYGQWLYTLREGGEALWTARDPRFIRYLTEPACYVFERRSLISGEVVADDERCFGEDLEDFPNDQPIDPHIALGDACSGELYACDIVDGRWDPDHCRAWTPTMPLEQLAAGRGACAVAEDPGALPWLLGAWLCLTRGSARRRRSSSRRGC
jgi:hypothetical protein